MKKRALAFFLALVMLASLLVMPIAAATPATIYTYLMNLAKTGTKEGEDYYYGYYISDELIYGIFWDKSMKQEELFLMSEDFYVCMFLPSSGKSPYLLYVRIGDNTIQANYSVTPSSYTGSNTLTLTAYEGDTSAKSQVAALAQQALNLILEFTLTELWDDGYRLKDLGFTKYTQHNVHYYDSGKVTTKPTCVDTGVKTYTCKICKTQQYDEEIPATGIHTWKLSQVFNPGYEDADGNVVHGSAKYTCKYCTATKNADLCAEVIFTDMPARNNYAHNAIDWAVFNGITDGTSDTTFSPNKGCTRGQVVTFLWRAAGKPAPSGSNPFTDVKSTAYYYDPVRWAVENGITTGTSETKFSPDNTCTRGQIVTFLWRYEGSPAPSALQSAGGASNEPASRVVRAGDDNFTLELAVQPAAIKTYGEDNVLAVATVSPCSVLKWYVYDANDNLYYQNAVENVSGGEVSITWTGLNQNGTHPAGKVDFSLVLVATDPDGSDHVANGYFSYDFGEACPFTDVAQGAYYYEAVLWAVEKGITKGTSDTEFSPTKTCTRAQVVTFLWRDVRMNSAAQASENGAQTLAALLDRAAEADVETVDAAAVPAYVAEDAAEQLPEVEAAEYGEVRSSANTLCELLATRGAADVICHAPRFSLQPDALSVLYALTEELQK